MSHTTLSCPSAPAAALEVARQFTPRFEAFGSLVVLDTSELSRLFGSPQELSKHIMHEFRARVTAQTKTRASGASWESTPSTPS